MNRPFHILVGLLLLSLGGCAELSQSDHDVRAAATDWLALLDAHAYKKAFDEEAPRVKAGSKEEDFLRFLTARRASLGNAKERTFTQVVPSRTMGSAPDGNYMTIIFKTKFERKAVCYERVILTSETGRWQVSGYQLR